MDIKEIICRIKRIDAELAQRKAERRLNAYNTGKVHKKQMEFHKTVDKKVRFVFGGNRSGKTECGAVETVWRARGIHPYRENKDDVFCWVVSPSYEVQRDVAQAKILSYLPPNWIKGIVMQSGKQSSPSHGIIDHIVVKNVLGGESVIGFKSVDQGREKFQGTSLDFVWFDEEPPEDVYRECCMRVIDRDGDVFCTMTPLLGMTFIYDEIYLSTSPDVWFTQMEWRDNPYLPEREVERLIATMDDEEQESRRFGRFTGDGGLVYPGFDVNVHLVDDFSVPTEWQEIISIDPGLNNPLSAHFYCVDYDGNIIVAGEHYKAGEGIEYHANAIHALADRLNWKRDDKGRLHALIDSAADQKTLAGTRSVSELFFDHGILVNTRVNKDMWTGIARVKELFATRPPTIFIFRSCVNLIRELKSYRWGSGDRPKKVDDHALDELRYFVMSRPKAPVREEEASAITRDKDRLVRQLKRRRWR